MRNLLKCLITSQISYLCIAKDIVYSVLWPSKQQQSQSCSSAYNVSSHEAWNNHGHGTVSFAYFISFCFEWRFTRKMGSTPGCGLCLINKLLKCSHLHKAMFSGYSYVPVLLYNCKQWSFQLHFSFHIAFLFRHGEVSQ